MCAAWAFAWVDNARLCASLEQDSQDEVGHYRDPFVNQADAETVTVVTAGRSYVFFGETIGKVDLFVKTTREGSSARYAGVEIGFKREDGAWVMTDSGSCSGEECILKARKAFGDMEAVD